ncbi:hypothetical protein ACP4OV_017126 [Aristida adscensionis]
MRRAGTIAYHGGNAGEQYKRPSLYLEKNALASASLTRQALPTVLLPRSSLICIEHGYCPYRTQDLVQNLTSYYTNRRNEGPTVATTVVMFGLAAVFSILNLFSRFSDVSAILNPSVRLFLSTSLSLFLPVMSYCSNDDLFGDDPEDPDFEEELVGFEGEEMGSHTYLFSEAKNNNQDKEKGELPVRARMILMWMLLVELLRKKAEAILVSAGVKGYSGTIERAARIGWLGYLVFNNLKSVGRKAFYGILWVLAAAKLVQRFVTSELARRSFAHGKNPQLLDSYMAKMLQRHGGDAGQLGPEELLKRCDYVVMGEEDLEKKAGPEGYELELADIATADADSGVVVVTVGKVWELAETDETLRKDPKLKRLCLSFALYKLLRRRLEDFPITAAEARNCHDLIFNGLCKEKQDGGTAAAAAAALFDVFNDEVQFLCEYYHSVQPVVLASPYFFLVNYILCPVVVWAFCLVTIILCSHGDVFYAFHRFDVDNDNYAVWLAAGAGCVQSRFFGAPHYIYSVVDICITILLLLTFAYEEVWEFVVFLLSNWFIVSLHCSYVSKPRWFLGGVIRRILWVRSVLGPTTLRVKQFSVLRLCRISWCLPTKAVPVQAKKAIFERLVKVAAGDDAAAPSNAWLKSHKCLQLIQTDDHDQPLLTFDRAGVAEVILSWHIATELLLARHPLPKQATPGAVVVATALSGYCAYLVAFHPELLPDNKDGTERVYEDTKAELKKEMGWFWYYCSGRSARCRKLMEIAEERVGVAAQEGVTALELREIEEVRAAVTAPEEAAAPEIREVAPGRPAVAALEEVKALKMREIEVRSPATASALRKGARLGKALVDRYAAAADDAARERVWELVVDVWTEVVAYAAPASSEVQVKAQREALAQGGEFVTVLWAIATHTGIARGAAPGTLSAPPPASAV